MVRRVSFAAVFALVALAALSARQMTSQSPAAFQEGGAQPSAERPAPKPGVLGPAPNFVGNTTTLDTTGYTIGRRIFAAGAHNATWHAHSAGQLVFAEKGRGRVAIQGQPIKELAVGESAFIPGGTFHWHGASPNEDFTMVYVTMGASKTSQGEPVTEDAYLGKRVASEVASQDRNLLRDRERSPRMPRLDTPDFCAHLDRLKTLCDRLEKAQNDDRRYRELMRRIRVETDALHATICRFQPPSRLKIVGVGS